MTLHKSKRCNGFFMLALVLILFVYIQLHQLFLCKLIYKVVTLLLFSL